MMHIPLVKSTPWLEPKRDRLLRILESRDHCVSLAGHTHHHEHVMIDESMGWKKPQPHHHIINVTVSGSWWSGRPDENDIPHTLCADGTPNGHTVMHFDGKKYLLEYRAARKSADYQIRVMAAEEIQDDNPSFYANVFNAMPAAIVEWRLGDGQEWQTMTRTTEADPLFRKRWEEEQKLSPELPWRKLPKPMNSPHLWKADLPTELPGGAHAIHVRCTNPNGQVLTGHRIFRVR
ncbi:MAG: hypothetical protein GY826_45000 [Fuerstiella sp.]|nr:hypothetical protein [Fuerstiella sp.]